MRGVRWYCIDLSLFDIVDKMSRGELICKYDSAITGSDIKALCEGIEQDYPFPTLVLFREADGRCRVVAGEKLVRTLIKFFMGTEESKRLTEKCRGIAVHGVIVESSNPNDGENIGKFFRRGFRYG